MQAVILAAGMGRRLGEFTKDNTKCMVELNGVKLIDRLLGQLSKLGLSRIVIVVGYKGDKLREYVDGRYGSTLRIEYATNPVYDKTNNIYSLWVARELLKEDDTLLIESDLALSDGIFKRLLGSPYANVALVARYESWMDGTMVKIDADNNIVSFVPKKAFSYSDVPSYYKTLNIYRLSREFLRSKYLPFLDAYIKSEGTNEYYENVLRIISFLDSHEIKALPLGSEKWYEIDDKQDLDIAEALFAGRADLLKKFYGRYGGYWRFPKMLDFCYLVNPYFRQSGIIDEMEANFRVLVGEYPSGMRVNTLLASKCWGVSESYIVPGNGAAELIKSLMGKIDGRLGLVRPTFEEYPNRYPTEKIVAFVPQGADYRYTAQDLMDFFAENHVDNIVLVNPDNPSGNFIPIADVLRLAAWCDERGVRLVVDESFVDFSVGYEDNSLLHDRLLEAHPRLVVVKSISKSYGVPGIRLGIMCSADKELIAAVKADVSIWNINSFAEFFMQVYSKYEGDYKLACDRFLAARDDFEAQLRSISFLRVMPSQANYFLCEVLPPYSAERMVVTMLEDHGILLRDCSGKPGLDGKQYMRIAVRSAADNNRLIDAFRSVEANACGRVEP